MSRGRHILVWVLIVLASVIALIAIMTVWVKRQVLDDHAWRAANTQVIENPKVQAALATYLVNQLYDNVNVEAALRQRLPSQLKPLAAPIAAGLEQPLTATATRVLGRPRVQQLYVNASSVAHDKLVNVLENKTGHGISTGNGVVTLDLRQLVLQLGQRVGLPASLLDRIPASVGTITIMRSNQLAAAQKGVRAIRVLSVWLAILVFAMYALAIYLARGARRAALRDVGWALIVIGLIVLIVRRATGNYAVDALASPTYKPTIHDVWLIGTAILGQLGYAAILYGIATVVAATIAGPTRIATAARRRVAPTLNERPLLVALPVLVLYLFILQQGPTHALRQWWGILLFAGLIAAGFFVLRRQTQREFPVTAPAAAPAAPAGPAPARAEASPADELARLAALHDQGVLSDDEFERAKALALS
jgi:hypothetical protein